MSAIVLARQTFETQPKPELHTELAQHDCPPPPQLVLSSPTSSSLSIRVSSGDEPHPPPTIPLIRVIRSSIFL